MILLLACVAPSEPPASQEALYAIDALEPTLTVDELGPAIDEALVEGFYLPIELFDWSLALFDGVVDAGTRCPTATTSAEVEGAWSSSWNGSCRGPTYEVSGDWQYVVTDVRSGAARVLSAYVLHSVWGVTLPDGHNFTAGGSMDVSANMTPGHLVVDMSLTGEWGEEGRADALAGGVSGGLEVNGEIGTDDGFTGTVDGSAYAPTAPIEFEDVTFTAGCAAPAGGLRVRDPGTGWWKIVLPDDCSGCGPASFGGEERGEVCVGEALTVLVESRLAAYMGAE